MAIDIKEYRDFESRKVRFGRYMRARVFPNIRKVEIATSHDGRYWNSCIIFTKHELLKLRKLIDKLLQHENLQ